MGPLRAPRRADNAHNAAKHSPPPRAGGRRRAAAHNRRGGRATTTTAAACADPERGRRGRRGRAVQRQRRRRRRQLVFRGGRRNVARRVQSHQFPPESLLLARAVNMTCVRADNEPPRAVSTTRTRARPAGHPPCSLPNIVLVFVVEETGGFNVGHQRGIAAGAVVRRVPAAARDLRTGPRTALSPRRGSQGASPRARRVALRGCQEGQRRGAESWEEDRVDPLPRPCSCPRLARQTLGCPFRGTTLS